jgi:hypothetical protein
MSKSWVLASPDNETVFVGVSHDGGFRLPPRVAAFVIDVGQKQGFWYEGDGGDNAKVLGQLGRVRWSGSWDGLVKSTSSDFYYTLFSNSKSGTKRVLDKLVNPDLSIIEALNKAGDGIAHEAIHGKTTPGKLKSFLSDCGAGLLESAKSLPANRLALNMFVRKGERVMWPANWRDAPTAASRVAKRANETRLQTILRKPGVYFLGADHLEYLRRMRGDLKIISSTGA